MKTLWTILLFLALSATARAGEGRPQAEAGDDDPTRRRPTRGQGVDGRFYDDARRGWYWFEEDPDRRRQLKPEPEAQTQAPAPSNPHKPLSVEWLRQELEDARVLAIDDPSPENVEYYALVEKLALDKASAFAAMRAQVALTNPALDETINNPVTTLARTARRDERSAELSRVLGSLAEKVGIYYFYKSDCPYCLKQNMSLLELQRMYDFAVLPIAIDARPMPDGAFANWRPDRGQAQMLAIEQTPTLYLMRPPSELVLLINGVQTLGGLEQRILQIAHANNWIDREDFDRAMRGAPNRLLVDALDGVEGVDWNDRSAALQALRSAAGQGVQRASAQDIFPTPSGQATRVNE